MVKRVCILLFLAVLVLLPVQSGSAKVIIAHRGASGYLPEHTLEAYAMAYAQGADFLEPDLMMTKDGVLIAMHDPTLQATTNVSTVFPGRARNDGQWYVADFTLSELKELSVNERKTGSRQVFPHRFPAGCGIFQIATLEELLLLVQGLNKSTGKNVGIYPEVKLSSWHRSQGFAVEEALLALLDQYGYLQANDNIFIQSFEEESLRYLRFQLGTELSLVQLISARQRFLTTAEGLDRIAEYANGIGPSKRLIENERGKPVNQLFLVKEAHSRGLIVHPYTFRQDQLPGYAENVEDEISRFLFEYGVDGVFTDFPDRAVPVVDGVL